MHPLCSVALVILVVVLLVALTYYYQIAQYHVLLSPEEVLAIGQRVNVRTMLATGMGFTFLHDHCVRELNAENLDCWQLIETFMKHPTVSGYKLIYIRHLAPDALEPANVTSAMFATAKQLHEKLEALVASLALPAPPSDQSGSLKSSTGGRRGSGSTGSQGAAYVVSHEIEQGLSDGAHALEQGLADGAHAIEQGLSMLLSSTTGALAAMKDKTLQKSTSLEATPALHKARSFGDKSLPLSSSSDKDTGSTSGSSLASTSRSRAATSGGGIDDNPEVVQVLEEVKVLLSRVQKEVVYLMEKDILPRFKASKQFAEYLSQEPLLYKKPVSSDAGWLGSKRQVSRVVPVARKEGEAGDQVAAEEGQGTDAVGLLGKASLYQQMRALLLPTKA